MELLRTLERRARERLPPEVYDYFAGGAGDERSLAEAERAWDRWWLVPRHLSGVARPELGVELLGTRHAAPILLAPVAAQRLLHPEGEVAVARAAASAGLVACLSTRATADLAEVASAAPDAERWFQLYVREGRDTTERVLGRLADHGYTHVVLTVDIPVPGRRERELRHPDLPLPDGVAIATHLGSGGRSTMTKPPVGGWDALTWGDVEWVASASGLPVVVKGVLSAHDAMQAVEHGAAAIAVSAHGGRQLDGVVPTAVALPDVVGAVEGRVPVLVDGGIRDGGDVARALALGADAVLVGRPYLWGLAAGGPDGAGGEAGVREVIDALVDDTERTLALLGAAGPADLAEHHVRRAD